MRKRKLEGSWQKKRYRRFRDKYDNLLIVKDPLPTRARSTAKVNGRPTKKKRYFRFRDKYGKLVAVKHPKLMLVHVPGRIRFAWRLRVLAEALRA